MSLLSVTCMFGIFEIAWVVIEAIDQLITSCFKREQCVSECLAFLLWESHFATREQRFHMNVKFYCIQSILHLFSFQGKFTCCENKLVQMANVVMLLSTYWDIDEGILNMTA